MFRASVALAVLLAACSGQGDAAPTSTAAIGATTTPSTAAPPTTTTLTTVESCDAVPYRPLTIPARATGAGADPTDLGDDPYTTIPGTSIRLWVDDDASSVMALIRGALPPEPWAGPTARIEVLRQDAALGLLPGDRWAVAWFESEERCDLYTLVLFPPTSAEETLEVAESLIPDR